jgi:hypothetical protein
MNSEQSGRICLTTKCFVTLTAGVLRSCYVICRFLCLQLNGNSEKRRPYCVGVPQDDPHLTPSPFWRLDGLKRGDNSRTQVPLEGRLLRKRARDLLVRYAHQVDVMSIPHRYKAAGEPHTFCLATEGSAWLLSSPLVVESKPEFITYRDEL